MRKELNNIKRFSFINLCLIVLCFFTLFTSCKKEETKQTNKKLNVENTLPENLKGIIKKDEKIYVTSIGQATDVLNFETMILKKSYSDYLYELETFMNVSDIKDGSTVLIFVGCSIKALSESGTTLAEELERATNFTKNKARKNLTFICFHIGGESRRGSTSDQFIELMLANSDYNIYLDKGNFDYLLSNTSVNNNIPCYEVKSILDTSIPFKYLCGIEVE